MKALLFTLLTLFIQLAACQRASSQNMNDVRWADSKIGLKIKGFGYNWRTVDSWLIDNGHQPIGDNPLTGFSFPLEFSFNIKEKPLPFGFVFQFTSGGTLSRALGADNYTRLRADIFLSGIYHTIKVKSFFMRSYLAYSRQHFKLYSFNAATGTNTAFAYTGAELSSQAGGLDAAMQIGLAPKRVRVQYGVEVSYARLIRHEPWQAVSGVPSAVPVLSSDVRNLGVGVFFYLMVF